MLGLPFLEQGSVQFILMGVMIIATYLIMKLTTPK